MSWSRRITEATMALSVPVGVVSTRAWKKKKKKKKSLDEPNRSLRRDLG